MLRCIIMQLKTHRILLAPEGRGPSSGIRPSRHPLHSISKDVRHSAVDLRIGQFLSYLGEIDGKLAGIDDKHFTAEDIEGRFTRVLVPFKAANAAPREAANGENIGGFHFAISHRFEASERLPEFGVSQVLSVTMTRTKSDGAAAAYRGYENLRFGLCIIRAESGQIYFEISRTGSSRAHSPNHNRMPLGKDRELIHRELLSMATDILFFNGELPSESLMGV